MASGLYTNKSSSYYYLSLNVGRGKRGVFVLTAIQVLDIHRRPAHHMWEKSAFEETASRFGYLLEVDRKLVVRSRVDRAWIKVGVESNVTSHRR